MPMSKVETLRAACCLAMIDQELSEGELRILRQLAEAAGVGQASFNAMIDRARRDNTFFEEMFRVMKREPIETMAVLFDVAVADKELTMEERVILHAYAERLGIDEALFEQMLAEAEQRVGRGK
jgi:DnaJ-domain-containing protein 1